MAGKVIAQLIWKLRGLSCASNFLIAGAINGEIEIGNLNLDSLQGDKVIIDLLKNIGVEISETNNWLSSFKGIKTICIWCGR